MHVWNENGGPPYSQQFRQFFSVLLVNRLRKTAEMQEQNNEDSEHGGTVLIMNEILQAHLDGFEYMASHRRSYHQQGSKQSWRDCVCEADTWCKFLVVPCLEAEI